jgi:hypothetical protein
MRVAIGPIPSLTIRERILGTASVLLARRLIGQGGVDGLAQRLAGIIERGPRPATRAEAERADQVVCAVRLSYLTEREAVPRATAAALLCAWQGTRVRWCWGVRTPPAESTAWVEAEDVAFGAVFNVREAFTVLVSSADAAS